MTAINGAVASKGASASDKPCLYHAKVDRLAATIATPSGSFKFYPVTEPYVATVPGFVVAARG